MRQFPKTMNGFLTHTRTACARPARTGRVVALIVCLLAVPTTALSAATHTTRNFRVSAASSEVARQVAHAAEEYRRQFSLDWFNAELPDWQTPCDVIVEQERSGGRGWTSYDIYRGRADRLRITLHGRLDRILEYVLPHEVAHTVLAVWLGRPIPRWADEGVALLAETESQQVRQRKVAAQLATADDIMPLHQLLRTVDYPEDRQELIGFYASSFSLTEFLVRRGGKERLLSFLQDCERGRWEEAICQHYEYSSPTALEADWKDWVVQAGRDPVVLASAPGPEASEPLGGGGGGE